MWASISLLVVSAGLAAIVVNYQHKPSESADPFALPALPSTPYLNTGPDAHYVGGKACRGCHNGAHRSFHSLRFAPPCDS